MVLSKKKTAMEMNDGQISTDISLCLPQRNVDALADVWLQEDCPSFDAGAVAAGAAHRTATLYAKSLILLAGTKFFDAVFAKMGCAVEWVVKDGETVRGTQKDKRKLARVSGAAHAILSGERPALNALAECTSVATASRRAVIMANDRKWHGVVAGTRKTAPGLRLVQKFGMLVGGMDCHRFDLSSMVMIKDNHIKASGSIVAAIKAVRNVCGFSIKVDVEAEDEEQAREACQGGADIVMLDNFEVDELKRVAEMIKKTWPNVLVEASGGVTVEGLAKFCLDSVDIVSLSINKYASAVDMSLKLDDF